MEMKEQCACTTIVINFLTFWFQNLKMPENYVFLRLGKTYEFQKLRNVMIFSNLNLRMGKP